MSGVFRNIDPPTPSPPGERVPPPPPLVRGWVERGVGGHIVRKTPDTALYSTFVSTLWCGLMTTRGVNVKSV
jgi:hypothetical protein